MDVGSRMVLSKLAAPELGERERGFLLTLAPAFTELEQTVGEQPVHGGRGAPADASTASRSSRRSPG